MMRRISLAAFVLLLAARADAANLYVNNTGTPACSDATAKASNSAASPWCSIGRAAWGGTTRSSPSASEAAAAGDVVLVTGGTYDYSSTVANRWDAVYLPANDGTVGSYIEFRCVGDCVLTAASANGPVIGGSQDYIKWYADISLGYSWQITVCGRTDITCGAGTVNITADTGPVVCNNATGCWFEGIIIDGGEQLNYTDNFDAFRFENATSPTVRNSSIANMRVASYGNAKAACIALYGTANGVFEYNECENAGGGVVFKDTGSTNEQSGNVIRYNLLDTIGECFSFSHVSAGSTEDRSDIYQNVCANADFALRVIDANNDWVVNNTFYNVSTGVFSNQNPTGIRWWNNVCQPCNRVHYYEVGTMPADTVFDAEHNAYGTIATFYTGTDGNRTFTSFKTAFSGQEQVSPASTDTDVLFASAGTGDYRICTAASTPVAGCAGASPAVSLAVDILDLDGDLSTSDNVNAGAYVTGSETIGLNLGAGATAPEAPTIGSASAGNARCVVTFTANGNGGSVITGYTATSSPGSITGTGSSSPITVTGLTNGTGYTFTVTATNTEGTSSASSASNSCTPAAPATQGIRINIRGTGEQDQAGAWRFHLDQVLEDPRGVPFPAR